MGHHKNLKKNNTTFIQINKYRALLFRLDKSKAFKLF